MSHLDPIMILCSDTKFDTDLAGKWDVCCVCACQIFICNSTLNSVIQNGMQGHPIHLYCLQCGNNPLKKIERIIRFTEEQKKELEDLGLKIDY